MQSLLGHLPDEPAIFSFVCRGLKDLPGVADASYAAAPADIPATSLVRFPLRIGDSKWGELLLTVSDPSVFAHYEPYVKNFCFMLTVMLEERQQRRLIQQHHAQLDQSIQERTQRLTDEIAEHQRTEAALRASEAKYRTLVENIPQKIFIKGRDHRWVAVNENFSRDFGLRPEDLVGKNDYNFFPKELADKYRADDQRVMWMGQTQEFEEKHLQNGRETWVHVIKVPVRDEAGKIIGVFGIFWDITDRKRAEEALQKREADLQLAQQIGYIGSWEVDLVSNTLQWSQETYRIFGCEPGTFTPSNEAFFKLVHADDLNGVQQTSTEALRTGGDYQIEHRIQRPDGQERIVLEQARILLDAQGQAARMIGTVQDITERKRAEAELRLQSAALNAAANAIMITDRAGVIAWVNAAFTRFTGYSAAEAIGKQPGELIKSGQHDAAFYRALWDTILAGKVWQGEMINRRKDGSLYTEELTITPLKNDRGEITHFIAVKQDITARKKVDLALASERNQLRTLIDNLPNCIYIKDVKGCFQITNLANVRLLGARAPEEILGKTVFDFFPPEIARRYDVDDKAVVNCGQSVIEREEPYEIGGNHGWFVTTKVPLRGVQGNIVGVVGISSDITERKRAAEAIKLFRTLVNQSNDAIEVLDPDTGRFLDVNEKGCLELGYSREEFLALSVFDIDPLVNPSVFKKTVEKLRKAGILMWEGIHRRKNGSTFPVEVNIKYVQLDRDYMVAVVRDITERKRVETEIQRQAAFARFNPNPVLELSDAGEINYFNAAAGEMARALGRQNPAQMLPTNTAGIVRECLATGQPRLRLVTQTGQRVISWSFFPVTSNNVVHCYAGDITERQRTEEQLREQASLLEKAQDAILVRDLDHRITYWNKSAERLYGWTAQEALGHSVVDLLCNNLTIFQPAYEQVIRTGEWLGELRQVGKAGRKLIVESRWTLVRDPAGQPKSILAINTDITERKKLEAQFLRVQRMESIGTLAGGIAHDLNNVLAPILMSVGVLQEKVTDEEGRALLTMLQSSAERGANLVRQVLSFARGVEGQRVVVNLVHVVREIQKIIQETFPKNIEFSLLPNRDLWTIAGDPTQLHQVFMNLCVNARDAMSAGGKLTVTMQNTVLDEVYAEMNPEAKPGTYVLVTVTDTGPGIQPAIRDKIFEPFFTTKAVGKGTGLGLSTTLAIVKSHGGFINLYSEPGQGATFKVYLPASTLPAAAEIASDQIKLLQGHGELVLVVDDETIIRSVAQKILERFGYRVLLAAHGAEGIALYAQHRDEIAVVLTDMAMPVMDGPATIIALKTMNPQVKIIASSGQAADSSVAQAVGAGVQRFIPKPYTAEAILKSLAEVLKES